MDENKTSLHGEIIKKLIKSWAKNNQFQMINDNLRNNLEGVLDIYTPDFFDQSVEWNLDYETIDKGVVSGVVYFIDENDTERSITFSVLSSGVIETEYE